MKFPWIRVIVAIIVLGAFLAWASTYTARAQSPTAALKGRTAYVGMETDMRVSVSLSGATGSVSGKMLFDNRLLRFTGVAPGEPGGVITFRHIPWVGASTQDTVFFSYAWTDPVVTSDSLLTFNFVPTQPGTAFVAAQNLIFDERGNDGITWVRGPIEVYPFELYPGLGSGGIPHDSVANVVGTRYILRSSAGDVSCDGTLSAYDASLLLRRIVGILPGLPSDDEEECPTPIVVELQDNQ